MDFSFLTPCALFRRSQQREMRHCTATLLFAVILYDLHDLFPEQDMFIVDCLIAVIMSKQPVMIPGLFLNLLKEIRERICLIVTVDRQSEISWGTVSDDVVHCPIVFVQVLSSPSILVFRRQLLWPPGLS